MERLYIDIETYSRQDVRNVGAYRHSEDDDFQILMAAWALGDEPVNVAIGREEVEAIPGLWNAAVTKVAHNAQFERVCFSAFAGWAPGAYFDPSGWHDTAAIAAERGYPRSLDALAKSLKVEHKDSAGTRLINLFCKPNRKGERNQPEDYPEEWAAFVEYCRQDVVVLREVDRVLGDWPTETERQVYLADQAVNDTGLLVDTDLCQAAVVALEGLLIVNELKISELTGIDNPSSIKQMSGWLIKQGVRLPNMQAATITNALAGDDLTDLQREVLELRQELALASVKKFPAALSQVSPDGRLRGRFMFHGAHTGRWAGRGAQPQNLPREALESETATEVAILDLLLGLGASTFVLKALVRAMFLGPLTVVDYASIEARVLAWLSGEEWALQAFHDGRDIYVETAARMSTPGNTLTRSQGKVAVLALGYNGGVNSLRAMGGEGTDAELKRLVWGWRGANANITDLWARLGVAFRLGGQVGDHLRIVKEGNTRHIHLPSGRVLSYRGVRARMEDTDYGPRWDLSFIDPGKNVRVRTYGGRLAENVTQAVARDFLAEAIIRLVKAGFRVMGHVHDEVIVEGEHLEAVRELMVQVPAWAPGFPLDGAGYVAQRYKKD